VVFHVGADVVEEAPRQVAAHVNFSGARRPCRQCSRGGATGRAPAILSWEGRRMIYLDGRKQDVNALAFSPDGKLLAVAGTASHVQLWRLDTREARKVLGPSGPHLAVAFLPGGRLLTVVKGPAMRVMALDGGGPVNEHVVSHGGAQANFISA